MHDLDDTIQQLRSTERRRLAALVERDMDTPTGSTPTTSVS
jgi:hypothetical protein